MLKGLVIYNPISGGKNKSVVLQTIKSNIDLSKFILVFQPTEQKGHAKEIALSAVNNSFDFVIAVGGDGTINEVVNGLINSNVPLGIIPCGSGNGFARHCKIPMNVKKATELINRFKLEEVDVIKINDSYAVNSCGWGFDAKVAKDFSETKKRGFFNYVQLVLKNLRKFKSVRIRYRIADKIFEDNFFMITITNSAQFGNNIYIEPRASVQDGILNLVCVHTFGLRHIPGLTNDLLTRKFYKNKKVTSNEVKSIEIITGSEFLHIDGEHSNAEYPIKISVIPRAIRVIC